MTERVERRLAAVLAADVAGYSRLMGVDEEGTLAQLKACRKALVDPTIAKHRGRIVKTTGDGMLVEFASAVDAARCSLEVQSGMAAQNEAFPPDRRIEFRIGIHVGDIMIDDNDIFGEGVNVAARLENECEPGGVCLSGSAFEQVRGKTSFVFDDLGERALKNIDRPVRLYAARIATEPLTASAKSTVECQKPLPLPDKPSIAVLPFQNMSGDPEQEYFADGMVEEIITALSRNKQLFVIARNSSFTFKGRAVDIKQVARDLGVRYVLEGSVRKSGNRIRITGQLIDAASGAHLWADKYDGALEDVFDLQDQVAASVAGAINPSVIGAEMERAKRKPTSSLDAYDCYLRGVAAHWRPHRTRESTAEAGTFLERAVELDPQFAAAYCQLGWVINFRRSQGWSTDPAGDTSRPIAYAKNALHLGRQDPIVLAKSAGLLALTSPDEVELAESFLEEAVRLDPNGPSAWMYAGWVKSLLGNHQTAIDYLQRAIRLSPLDASSWFAFTGMAYASFFLGNYGEALRHAAVVLRDQPNNLPAMRVAMASHVLSDNMEAAQKLWQQIVQLSPSVCISELARMAAWRDRDLAKLQEAYRLAGMPE